MKQYYLILLIALTPFLVQSQVSGYMGKRMCIVYDLGITPNIFPIWMAGESRKPDGDRRSIIGFQFSQGVNASVVLSRRLEMYGGYSKQTSVLYPTSEGVPQFFREENSAKYPGVRLIDGSPRGTKIVANYQTWEFGFNLFSKGSIAPVGRYTKFGLAFVPVDITQTDSLKRTVRNMSESFVALKTKFGVKRVVADWLVVDTYIGVSLPAHIWFAEKGEIQDFKDWTVRNYCAHTLLTVGISVGLIPF